MKKKLKECQGLRTQAYQHLENYIEGDKVWYQPINGISWLGPAAVLCQRDQSVLLHTNGDIKKVAVCKVKPYELVDRKENEEEEVSKKFMLDDGLEDVESLANPEKEELNDALLADTVSDNVGANY